jgi:hypothetical protein
MTGNNQKCGVTSLQEQSPSRTGEELTKPPAGNENEKKLRYDSLMQPLHFPPLFEENKKIEGNTA